MKVMHARVQHGVGQGSFHSATVEAISDSNRVRFDYVYDCGARSGSGISKELMQNIKRLGLESRAGSSNRCVLDVIVLSHYDTDHLNGAKYLSERFAVQRIFLPYLSPDELVFVIASHIGMLSAEQIAELHQLALGSGRLWNIPVTMVRGGEAGDEEPSIIQDTPPATTDESSSGAPQYVRLSLSGTGIASAGQKNSCLISHKSDVLAKLADGKKLWKLRFWNRGLDVKLAATIKANLTTCGFPLSKLQDQDGVVDINGWLATPKNRKAAVKAYGDAIESFNPDWADEAKSGGLANLLSLAMYSGPDFSLSASHRDWRHRATSYRSCLWMCERDLVDKVGWIGTGDASLGETDVWKDFSNHYASELSEIGTCLVPHHGAAPDRGPMYYNAGLNLTAGVASVISYGTNNSYGHPKFSVLSQVIANHGVLFEVTEKDENGFHEVFCLND